MRARALQQAGVAHHDELSDRPLTLERRRSVAFQDSPPRPELDCRPGAEVDRLPYSRSDLHSTNEERTLARIRRPEQISRPTK
jgi:hypothetical protein